MKQSARYRWLMERLATRWIAGVARHALVLLSGAVVAVLIGLASPAAAKAIQPAPVALGVPMRVVLVQGSDPGCTGPCPAWISAEGTIGPETPSAFRKVFKSVGSRKVPVFMNSTGGSVEAALAIGRMLRARHLDISITRTRFDGCAPTDPVCGKSRGFKGYHGTPYSADAFCASACAFLIAGGERRFISMFSHVGVHEITVLERRVVRQYQVMTREENGRKVEVSRKLVSENASDPVIIKNASATQKYREQIAQYYREMGVANEIVDLAFATKASEIHWMTRSELADTHLLTNPIGGEVLVGFGASPVPSATPVAGAARVTSVAVPAPVIPLKPDLPGTAAAPASPVQAPPFETAELGDVPINALFDADLLFTHRQGEPRVAWSAMIRENGLSRPAGQLAVRLELDGGRGFSASPSIMDPPPSVKLHGEMDLSDYCDVARSSAVRIELTAPRSAGKNGLEEIVSEPKSLSLDKQQWSECVSQGASVAQSPAP